MSVEQNGPGYYDQAGKPVIISREGHVEDIASVLSPKHFEVFVGLPRESHQLLFEASYLASLSDPDEADKVMLAIYNKWFCDGVDPEDETTLGELAAFGDKMPTHIERYVNAKHRVLGMASLRSAVAAHLEREQINAEQVDNQIAEVIDLDVRRTDALVSSVDVSPHEADAQGNSLQLREQNYVAGIFGDKTMQEATTEDRELLAQAVAHMHLFKRRKRRGSDDTPLERMGYFFSDMSYEDIIQKAKQAGRAGSSISERAFYSNTKTAITEKFTQEQARLVLEMVRSGEPIDWSAVGALEGDDSLRDEPDPRPRKKQAPSRAPLPELPGAIVDLDAPVKIAEEDATPAELKAFAERAEIDLSKNDVFMIAYHPPKDWQKSEGFKARFDELTAATIERAVLTTRLTEPNANFIKSRLGLPVIVRTGSSQVPDKPLEYLRAIESSTPGRLARAQEYPRIRAMTTALRLFTNNKLPLEGVVEKFGNNPEAGLLLKGAIVEVMLASMQAAAKNKARYEQP